MAKKYTAKDFANARFAEHPDGRVTSRCEPGTDYPWENNKFVLSDEEMADKGWVPVPTNPTITRTEFLSAVNDVIESQYATPEARCQEFTQSLGIEIIPDPEPTNRDKLADILVESFNSMEFNLEDSFGEIAAVLDKHGVTAPKVKGN